MSSDDLPPLPLAPLDLDAARAAAIAARARAALGHGPPARRWLEPIAVAVFVVIVLAWAALKIASLLGL